MKIKSVEVVGDTGIAYTVTTSDTGKVTCTCPAFQFQRIMSPDCKHIRFIAASFAVPVA